MRPLRKPEIASLLQKHGLTPNKRFGQHFLADPQLLEALVSDCRIEPSETVLEIGGGTGNLTVLLASAALQVLSVEVDRFLWPVLEEVTGGLPNVRILEGDFLDLDLAQVERAHGPFVVVGNLPYYISTEIMLRVCQARAVVKRACFTVQKEVAERAQAEAGTPEYGRLSIAMQTSGRVRILRRISRYAFLPIPKVDSAFLELDFSERPHPRPADPRLFDAIVQAAFEKRRKTLRNALKGLEGREGVGPERIDAALETCGIDPRRRGETLTVTEYTRLSDALGAG